MKVEDRERQRTRLTDFLREWLSHGQDDGTHDVWDGCCFEEANAAAPVLAADLMPLIASFVDEEFWECPSCGFAMHHNHTDLDGVSYTCPLCVPEQTSSGSPS